MVATLPTFVRSRSNQRQCILFDQIWRAPAKNAAQCTNNVCNISSENPTVCERWLIIHGLSGKSLIFKSPKIMIIPTVLIGCELYLACTCP